MRQKPPIGRFRVTQGDPWRWGKLRDGLNVAVPVTATFTPDQPSDFPSIELDVDEHSGSLVVTRVTLTGTAERPIQSDALRVYSLNVLTAIAAQRTAVPAVGWEHATDEWPPPNAKVMESIVAATRSRTNVDRERLEDVARFHKAGGVRTVEEALNVSRSQAYRLIKLAREQGYIEEAGASRRARGFERPATSPVGAHLKARPARSGSSARSTPRST
jgi:hypothetical protein